MNIRNMKPLAVAIGAALAAAMPAVAADDATDNPFALDELRDGYHQFAKAHGKDGDCGGDGDCSGDGDGHCSGDKGDADAEDADADAPTEEEA